MAEFAASRASEPRSDGFPGDPAYSGYQRHAARDEQAAVGYPRRHHAELVLLDEGGELFHLGLERGFIEVLLDVWILGLAARVGLAVRHVEGVPAVECIGL